MVVILLRNINDRKTKKNRVKQGRTVKTGGGKGKQKKT